VLCRPLWLVVDRYGLEQGRNREDPTQNIAFIVRQTVISVVRLVNRTGAALGIYMVLGVFRTYSEHCGLLAQLASAQA
jgi:hypothetical protein